MIFSQSIRWRIQLWHTLLLAVIVSALLYAFHQSQREITYEILDKELSAPITGLLPRMERAGPERPPRSEPGAPDEFERLLEELAPEPEGQPRPVIGPGARRPDGSRRPRRPGGSDGPGRTGPPGIQNQDELDERMTELEEFGIYIVAWGRPQDLVIYQSPNAPDPLPSRPSVSETGYSSRTRDGFREIVHVSPGGRIIVSGTSLEPYEEKLTSLQYRLIAIGVGLTTFGFFVGWFLVSRSLRPVKQISGTANRIAKGDLSSRIEISKPESELGQLSTVLNDTFEKLETSFEHQVRFTADASHEMRTPVAVILAKAQFALARERSPEKYQQALQTCHDSAQHMRSLIDSLLDLARIDSGEFNIRKEPGDLSTTTREVIELIRPLAEEREITLDSNLNHAQLPFDAQRMRQAILNLLSNAVKYNRREGRIAVTLSSDKQGATLSISDTGNGIPAENIPHLFERFYRADRSRTRGKEGSTGLGLAITHAIVKAHGGSIEVESELDVGTTFTIRIPSDE